MEKHIITYYESTNPTTSNNIASGYGLGQHWFNYITGVGYIHKSDGVWVLNADSSLLLNYLPLSGGALSGNLGINTTPSHQLDIVNTSNQRTVYGINSVQTAEVLQQDIYSTGYDETLINPWYGWKFTASGNHTMGSLSIRLKSIGTITNIDGYIRLRLFSDNGIQPTTLLYTSDLIRMGSVTSSYVEYLFGGDYTLTTGVNYWILVERSEPVTGGGSITIDRDSEALSTTTDGITWEINSGIGRFAIYGQTPYAVYGFSTNQNPIFGRSINSSAVAGYSLNSNGIYGFSQNQVGIHGDSIYATGVYGSSKNSEGVSGVSIHGRAASFYIGDGATKLTQNNNSSVLNATRQSDGNSTFSVSGNILSLTDNPTNCSSVSGSLISGVIDSVERFNVNPRVIDNSNAVASFIDTKNTLIDISAKLLSLRNGGVEKAYFNPYGKLQLGMLNVGGDGDYVTLLSLGGLYSNSPGYYPKIKIWDNGTNYYGLGVSANQYELMAPLHAHFSYIINNTEKYRIDTDGNSIYKIGNYIYQSTDFSSDTVNDTRSYVISGVTINEICTVANATKGAGTWVQTINIDASGKLTSNSFIKSGGTSTQFLMADGSTDSNSYLATTNKITTANVESAIDLRHSVGSDLPTQINIGTLINSVTEKATLLDADEFAVMDSADSNKLKKHSKENLKAALDLRYAKLTGSYFTGEVSALNGLEAAKLYPGDDSTTAIQITNAGESQVIANIDTTNGRVGFGTASPACKVHIEDTTISQNYEIFKVVGSNGSISFQSDSAFPRMKFDIVHTTTPTAGRTVFSTRLNADTYARFGFDGYGKLLWGAGGATDLDTNLYRNAAGILKTDSALIVVGDTTVSKLKPSADGTTAIQFTKADGTTAVLTLDTSATRPLVRIGTTSVAGTSMPTVFSLGGSYSATKGYFPKLKLFDDGTNYFGLGVSANCYELMAPLDAYFSFSVNKIEKLTIGIDGSIIQPNSIYNYQGASQTADTVNDTRESSFSGKKIYEVCTVANATKGAGSWVTYKTIQLITITDSNELIGSGSYVDLISNKSGRGSIFFGDGVGYADFIFTSAAVVTFIYNSSNVFTSVQTGTNHVIVKDNGSNVRIINELGVTSNFHIEVIYNQ